jgi:phosphate-selective porin OprO and OprP
MTTIGRHCLLALAILLGVSLSIPVMAAPEITGRIHLDYAFHDEDNSELADGHRLRRARLDAFGSIDADWSYVSAIDFAENEVAFQDLYLRYSGLERGVVTLGSFKVPFGMDRLTSSNHLTFIERSLINDFTQGRRVGAGYGHATGSLGFAGMVFGESLGSHQDRVDTGTDESFGLGARIYTTPLRSEAATLHFGAAFTTEQPLDRDNNTARFRTRPESRVTGVRLVDTGLIENVDRINQFGLEAAYLAGPLALQGEYMNARAKSESGFDSHAFDGYYAQASYVLGGSQRSYRAGVFRNPAPGSWELALRYSSINLNDGDVLGGEQDNITLGLNWYAAPAIRFMWNYIRVNSERQGISDDPAIFLMRAQVSY